MDNIAGNQFIDHPDMNGFCVEPKIITYKGGAKFGAGIGQVFDENGKAIPFHDPRTAKARSKTFSGVAKAMADTWG